MAPVGGLEGPSQAIAVDKSEFGSSRIQRWFGRTWTPVELSTTP
jgi:sulfide:quinone oxidoreductase